MKESQALESTSVKAMQAMFADMTTEQLHQEFRQGLRITVQHLNRQACILLELEKRGQITVGVEAGLLDLLRRIANGTMLAETVVRFATAPKTMRRIGSLPIEEQEEIVSDDARVEELLNGSQRGADGTSPRAAKDAARRTARRESARAGEAQQNPLIAASLATVKDLAEQIADMISCHPEPEAVWAALCQQPAVKRLMK